MPRLDAHSAAHLEWIGFVRPTGLVVSPTALVRAGVILDRRDIEGQRRLGEWAAEGKGDFRSFAASVLGWSFSMRGYAGTVERPVPDDLILVTPDAGHLEPDYAVRMERERRRGGGSGETQPWQLLVCDLAAGEEFDTITRAPAKGGGVERHETEYGQLSIDYDTDEERQLHANMAHWRLRQSQFEQDLANEPDRIRDFYAVRAQRIEPVGLVYLWPETN